MVCARPSLGQDRYGSLFVAWEEFDGVNVEPTTNLLRADISCSYSTDNGVTWADRTKTTNGGDVSNRFPSILNPIDDSVMVEYLIDQVAGFWVDGEGPATENPVVVQRVVWTGLAEGQSQIARLEPTATIARRVLFLPEAASHQSQAASLLDLAGRKVLDLTPGANDVRALAPGVYFVRGPKTEYGRPAQAVRKVVVTR
jgi:hypothetical protein